MITSKVENVQGNGSWEGKYGTMYSYEYKFENGEVGLANHKTNTAKYNKGESVSYEMAKDLQGNNSIKFITVDKTYNNQQNSTSSFALSYAKDLVVADKIPIDKIIDTATKLNNWLKQN